MNARRFCTIAAMDGDLQGVLDAWRIALLDAQADYPALSGAAPVTLPPFEQLQDSRARYIDLGADVTIVLSSDAERVRVVSDSVGDGLLTPASGVIITLAGDALIHNGAPASSD